MNRLYFVVLFWCLPIYFVFAQEPDSLQISRVFTLGAITVTSPKSKNAVIQKTNLKFNRTDIAQSLSSLPAVFFTNVGSKNESAIFIRGFDSRSIQVYIDGIPVYTIYDGYVDLARFKTFNYSVVSVSKGFSPMEFGPNAIGGAINLVSLKPTEKIEIQATTAFGSGKFAEYGINVGSRFNNFYFQGSFQKSHTNFFPLSAKYTATPFEDGDERENSYSIDQKINLKMGYIPTGNHEFSLSYMNQTGEKGNPPYSGNDEYIPTRFWQWPAWNKQSVYFISKHKITCNSIVKFRFFYDEFYNELKSFDDETYTTQTSKPAFTSIYDDFTYGGNIVIANNLGSKNKVNLSIHFKNDFHSEYNIGEPARDFNDLTWSTGIDETYRLNERILFKAGLSYNFRKGLHADNYDSNSGQISSFPLVKKGAMNAQAGIDFMINKTNSITFYTAHRTRFATLKDRYSYRLGKTLPNPELAAEEAFHNNLSFKTMIAEKLIIETSLYYIFLTNTIQMVDNVMPGISQLQNTGKSVFRGADFSGTYHLKNMGRFDLNYSYIIRKNFDNPELLFTNVPQNKIWANLEISRFKKISFHFNPEYNSKRYSTSYGTFAEAFTLTNIFASYKISQLEVFSGINNIFDKNYEYQEGYPAPGRSFFVRLLFELN